MNKGIYKSGGFNQLDYLSLKNLIGEPNAAEVDKLYVIGHELHYNQNGSDINLSSIAAAVYWDRNIGTSTLVPSVDPNDNIDIGTGILNCAGYTDFYVTIEVPLGEITATALTGFTATSIIGALNEVKTAVQTGEALKLAIYPSPGEIVSDRYNDGTYDLSVQLAGHVLSADRVYSIPDSGADANFIMSEGDQIIDGIKTFNKNPIMPQAVISALDIDWDVATMRWKDVTGDSTFTFSNAADGKQIIVTITADGTNRACNFPAGIKWTGGAPLGTTILANTANIYTFVQMNGIIRGSVIENQF